MKSKNLASALAMFFSIFLFETVQAHVVPGISITAIGEGQIIAIGETSMARSPYFRELIQETTEGLKIQVGPCEPLSRVIISFSSDQTYIPMDQDTDQFTISYPCNAKQNLLFRISSRQSQGLIPQITLQDESLERSEVKIQNGPYALTYSNENPGTFFMEFAPFIRPLHTVPFEMEVHRNNAPLPLEIVVRGELFQMGDLRSKDKGMSFVMNNYGNTYLQTSSGAVVPAPGFVPSMLTTDMEDQNKTYALTDFRKAFGNIDLIGDYDSTQIRQLMDTLFALPESMVNSLDGIKMIAPTHWYLHRKKAQAFARKRNHTIYLSSTRSSAVTAHEIAHQRTFDLAKTNFLRDWKASSTHAYNKNLLKDKKFPHWEEEAPYLSNGLPNGAAFEPRNGFTDPYGSVSIFEDVAQYVYHVLLHRYTQDNFWPALMDPQNPSSDIYRKRLELLKQYEFVSSDDIAYILK